MMGDKTESEFVRAEYVDGKFREHDRKHKADMDGVRVAFKQAADKHNELRSDVDQMKNSIVALHAEVNSLREMMVLMFQKGQVDVKNKEEWICSTDALNIIKQENLCTVKFGDISAALIWAGYVERYPSGLSLKLTSEGRKIKYIKANGSRTQILFNRYKIQELANLIEDYHDFLRNARRGK